MKKELLNCVALSNEFARKAEIDLSCCEWKLLLFLISRIKPHEKLFLLEMVSVKEAMDITDISTKSIIQKAVERLQNCTFNLEEKKLKLFTLIKLEDKYITYMFSIDMQNHILNLKDNMTIFELGYVYNLTSKYAIRLFVFGMSFKFCGYYNVLDYDFLKLLNFSASPSELWRRAIIPALEQIKAHTQINLYCKKHGNRYYFYSKEKTKKQIESSGIDKWKSEITTDVVDYSSIETVLFANIDDEEF